MKVHPTRSARIAIILASSLLWSSCHNATDKPAVEGDLLDFQEVFTLSRVVKLETDPDDPIGNPGALAKWGERIAIVDGMQKNVKIFDLAGRHLSTLGRAGDGPGEFRRPFDAIILNDGRLAVADKMNTRVSMFAADGAYDGSWNFTFGPAGTAIGIEGGKAVLVSVRPTDGHRGGANLHVHETNGELRKTIQVVDSLPDARATSVGMPMVAVLLDNVYVVEPTLRRMHVVGLHDESQRTMELSLPSAIWKDWDWSETPQQQDEGIKWVLQQTWIREPIGDRSDEFILPVSRFNAGPSEETVTSYVRVTAEGVVAAATLPSPRWITSMAGDTAYGAEITSDGESVLYVYAVRWPASN